MAKLKRPILKLVDKFEDALELSDASGWRVQLHLRWKGEPGLVILLDREQAAEARDWLAAFVERTPIKAPRVTAPAPRGRHAAE